MPSRLGYQPALDGIRAVAITAVVGFHTFDYPRDGYLGVDLFFALSGFLITTLLLEEYHENGLVSLKKFYRRRILRLVPALTALLAVYVACIALKAALAQNMSSLVHALLGALAGIAYVSNFVLAAHGVNGLPQPVNHLWSLAAEEQFYLLWPPVLFLVLRGRMRWALLVVLVGIGLLTFREIQLHATRVPGYRLDFGPDTRGVAILVGCLTGLVFTSGARSSLEKVTRWLEPVAVIAFLVLVLIDLGTRLHSGLLTVYAFVGSVLIVRAITVGSPVRRALASRPLVFLGKISYSLYLWHIPVLAALRIDGDHRFVAGGPFRKMIALILCFGAACCSYYFVERPFLRRKRELRGERLSSVQVATTSMGQQIGSTSIVTGVVSKATELA